ncbi:MAG: glycosyltransferase family 2 protein [Polyangiaceae bacterium]|nr:glycosyltransferase family 2 protein [Polyangiaceae bacterium]MCW5790726.1 glycosyltransferase family 2 protein [Polyangiaceae bacterium]
MAPEISIVIPVYNEERILEAAVTELLERLSPLGWRFEIILAENGSKDSTPQLAEALVAQFPEVRTLSVGEPNYGLALRRGIQAARGELVLCDEIDLCDTEFHQAAVELLRQGEAELVIGSKLIAGAADERPFTRHAASIAYTTLLRLLLGFRGTDTHGLKAFRRAALIDLVDACVVDKDVFASELVIRAYRAERQVVEIPVQLSEKRPPSIHLWRRVPGVLKSVAKLTYAIRLR